MSLREEVFKYEVERQPVGHVLTLALFVRHHVDLTLKAAFGHRIDKIPHAVGLHPQHFLQRVTRHRFEIDRSVVARPAVERAAHRIDLLEKRIARQVLRTLEQHVLEEVRETGLARFFTIAAHMVLDRHRHHRVGFILVQNHLETVVEFVFFIFQGCGIPVFTAAHACHNSSHQ